MAKYVNILPSVTATAATVATAAATVSTIMTITAATVFGVKTQFRKTVCRFCLKPRPPDPTQPHNITKRQNTSIWHHMPRNQCAIS